MLRTRYRDRGRSKKVSSGGTPTYFSFTNDAKSNASYTDDAKTNKRLFGRATAKLHGESVIVLFGDSLEQHNGTGSASSGSEEASYWSRGYANWWQWLDRRGRCFSWFDASQATKFFTNHNQGISGNKCDQMRARKTDVTNIPNVKIVIMGGGTNDINAARTLAAIQADRRDMYDTFIAAGIKIIIVTVPPRPLVGVDSWASGSAMRNDWMTLCAWEQAQADADPTNIQIVRRDLICSNNDADRTPKTGYIDAVDNVHLTPLGGYHIAADSGGLNEKVANWVDPFTSFPQSVTTGDLSNIATMPGTGGTISTGASGVTANNTRLRRTAGSTGVTVVGSKETINGEEYQKLVFTRDGTGSTATFNLDRSAGDITTGIPPLGTWLIGWLKAKYTGGGVQTVTMETRSQPSTPANMDNYSMKIYTGYTWPDVTVAAANGDGLWQSTLPWQIKAGTTSIIFKSVIVIDNTTAGTDTVWISRMQLVPIIDPTIEF